MGSRSRVFLFFVIATCELSGCGPNLAPLQRAVHGQRWNDAAQLTEKDSSLITHFAAMIIEEEALQNEQPKPWILLLRPDTDAGLAALERIAAKGTSPASVQMAQIILDRHRENSPNDIPDDWKKNDGNVRSLFATSFAHNLPTDQLLQLLTDINATVRSASIAALCRRSLTTDESSQVAERLRTDPVPHVRAAAARCAKALQPDALSLLADAIYAEKNDGVVDAALEGMLRLGTADAVLFLHHYMEGPMTVRKVFAAALLSERSFPTAQNRLTDALNDHSETVRIAAIRALQRTSLPTQRKYLTAALTRSGQEAFAAAAVMLQKNIETEKAVALLKKYFSEDLLAPMPMITLARRGDAYALTRLSAALQDPVFLVAHASKLRGLSALRESIVPLLTHTELEVRLAAAEWVLFSVAE